jgi:hypothetical protein
MTRFDRRWGLVVSCVLMVTAGCHRRQAPAAPTAAAQPAPAMPQLAPPPAQIDPEQEEEPSGGPSNSPVSLTASDGTGLQVVAFEARAVVEDPLAFTELHLVFRNPQARTLEGQFEITLPPTATLSRFAMKQDWGWQEGEVVEKQAARVAYEDFLHRRQDPALLEKQPGNQFHARVFPIPASGEKEIILSYSEALARTGVPYRVHLRGLPVLERLDVSAQVSRRQSRGPLAAADGAPYLTETVGLHRVHVQPDADFTIAIPAIAQQPQSGLRHEGLAVARVRPFATEAADPIDPHRGLYVLFDTSASRALDFEAQIARLGEVLGALAQAGAAQAPLKVTCFDQELQLAYQGTIGGFDEAARDKIRARRALGASDLGAALAAIAKDEHRWGRVLVVTDGIATAGAIEGAPLGKRVAALAQAGVERLDAIVAGGVRDADRLAALVTGGLPHAGVVIDASRPAAAIARRLGRATVSHLRVSVPGARWSWPAELDGLQPGDEALVYATLPPGEPMVVNLDGSGDHATHISYPIPLHTVERPLIERALVDAELRKLAAERAAAGPDKAAEVTRRIVALSTKHRVLCDETALLVLESEDDYARFQIDRRALSDILTVGKSGALEVMRRAGQKLAHAPEQVPDWIKKQGDESSAAGKRHKSENGGERAGLYGLRGPHELQAASDFKEAGDLGGSFGLSVSGVGQGGGGTGEGTIALGNLGTIGHGRAGGGSGAGDGRGAGQLAVLAPAASPASPPSPAPSAARGHHDALAGLSSTDLDREENARRVAAPNHNVADPSERPEVDPYEGKLKEVMALLAAHHYQAAEQKALAWRASAPGDVLALIALGEVAERRGERKLAARAYGSLIDLFPGRADLRRFAGERLERLGEAGRSLAIDTYKKARDQRPDHPASHRLLAYAQLRMGDAEAAFDTIVAGAARQYPEGRFLGGDRILREDVGLIAAAWLRKQPRAKARIEAAVAKAGAEIATTRSLRFVLNWETDANDVDFHIHDGQGGHAYYQHKQLGSGGELYADVTTGYGPECFTITGEPTAYPYKLQAHYYSRGPMGYGMGKLEIIEHDGAGNLRFEERPFVIMADNAFVDLGQINGPLDAPMHASR